MPMRRRLVLCSLLALGVLAHAPGAAAQSEGRRGGGGEARTLSLDEAVARVRRRTSGTVIGARTRGGVHHVKVLSRGGRIRVYRVDARTGRVTR